MGRNGLNQASVQRYSALKTLRAARTVIWLKLISLKFMTCIVCLTGLVMYAYYATLRCDPMASGQISNGNQLLPYFVMTLFGHAPGLAGLFLATLYSGALSSVSSYLSAAAANTWEDGFKHYLGNKISDYKATLLNRGLVVFYGVLSACIAFVAAYVPGPVTQVAVALGGTSAGPLYGTFFLGGLFRRANWLGALVGTITALAFNWWVIIGSMTVKGYHSRLPPAPVDGCWASNVTELTSSVSMADMTTLAGAITNGTTISAVSTEAPHVLTGVSKLYTISYQWYGLIGSIITIVVGILVSLVAEALGLATATNKPDELFIWSRNVFLCNDPPPMEDMSPDDSKNVYDIKLENTQEPHRPEEITDLLTEKHKQISTNGDGATVVYHR